MSDVVNVLYVEDNEGDIELLRMSLERYSTPLPIILHTFETVAEGVSAYTNNEYDAVFVDWNLPDGEGVELVDFIRKTNLSIPVILMSGVLTEAHLAMAKQYNPTICVEKSYDQDFIDLIAKYLFVTM